MLNDNLGKIGTIVNGTKLNAGISVANGGSIKLGEITLPPGKWLIVCGGWTPINVNGMVYLSSDTWDGATTNLRLFNFSSIIDVTSKRTIDLMGENYSGNATTISSSYNFKAIRIA